MRNGGTRVRRVELTHRTQAVRKGEAELSRKLTVALRAIGKAVAKKLAHLSKAEEEDERDALDAVDWRPVAKTAEVELTAVAKDGAQLALVAIGVETDESITSQTFTGAVDWAKARAAELVGKTWDEDGNLVDNPNAEMAITDTLRDELREAVASAIEDGDSAAELAERIEELSVFSAERADMIARTEILRAHNSASIIAMRESGVVDKKEWSTANDEDVSEECAANEEAGPVDLEDDFPSGDDAPPAHPNCRCDVVAFIPEASDEESDGGSEDSTDDEDAADEAAE